MKPTTLSLPLKSLIGGYQNTKQSQPQMFESTGAREVGASPRGDGVTLSGVDSSNSGSTRREGESLLRTGLSVALGAASAVVHLPRTFLAPLLAYTHKETETLSVGKMRKMNVGAESLAVVSSATVIVGALTAALGVAGSGLWAGAAFGGLGGLGTFLVTATSDLDQRDKPFFNQDRISAAKTTAYNDTSGPKLKKTGAAILAGYREALVESYERGAKLAHQ